MDRPGHRCGCASTLRPLSGHGWRTNATCWVTGRRPDPGAGRSGSVSVLRVHRGGHDHGVWAIMLDEGVCLGSPLTFYRLLRAASGTRERRRQATHPAAAKPELCATTPNQV